MSDQSSSQIAALQHIVRIQDDMLRGNKKSEIAKMWRNEAYKATVQRRLVEEETVRMGRELIGQIINQRAVIGATIGREFGRTIRAFEETASKSILSIDKRLQRLELSVGNLARVFPRQEDSKESFEELRRKNERLVEQNDALKAELEMMKDKLAASERENKKITREFADFFSTSQRCNASSIQDEKRKPSVHEVLREIKELEREAQRLLIKK